MATSRLAERLAAAPVRSETWCHLITVVVFVSEPDEEARLSTTLASLCAQRYRNIEVLVTGLPNKIAADSIDFGGHRGLFFEPTLSPLDILASPATDRVWRGSYVVFARAGTEFAPDAFVLFNAALNPAYGNALPDLVLCDHDRLTVGGEHTAPSFIPGWDPELICAFDYIETAFIASRVLVVAQRAAGRPASLHHWLCSVARGLRQPLVGHIAEPLVHVPADTPQPTLAPVTPLASPPKSSAETPRMAIIIPSHNKPELLKRCLGFLEFPNRFQPELVISTTRAKTPT